MGKNDFCVGCPYENENTRVVKSRNLEKSVLLVMQSPGTCENATGKPLSGKKGSSATKILEKFLPVGKTLDDYAIAELVRCTPGKSQPKSAAIAICYRYLENEINGNNYKIIVCFGVDAGPIVKNIKKRLSKEFEVVACPYPRNSITKEEENLIIQALDF